LENIIIRPRRDGYSVCTDAIFRPWGTDGRHLGKIPK